MGPSLALTANNEAPSGHLVRMVNCPGGHWALWVTRGTPACTLDTGTVGTIWEPRISPSSSSTEKGVRGPALPLQGSQRPELFVKQKAISLPSPFNHLMAGTPDAPAQVSGAPAAVTTATFGPASPHYSRDRDAHN